jgi:GAF domain-containing protein
VPITAAGDVLGCLCLIRRPARSPFNEVDDATAGLLARQVGVALSAVRTAQAHRSLLDSLGVGDQRAGDPLVGDGPSPVVRRLLSAARAITGVDLMFLSHLHEGTQTFTAVDTDGRAASGAPALAEGTTINASEGYCTLMLHEAIPTSVPDVASRPVLGAMGVTTDLGIGAYCGVPVRLPDGALYGTLCGLSSAAASPLANAQVGALDTIATLLGAHVAEEAAHAAVHQGRRAAFGPLLDGSRRSIVIQPIVDLDQGRLVGYEALSRFTDASGAPLRSRCISRWRGVGRRSA